MAKKRSRLVRNLPLILALAGMGTAIKYALDWKSEWNHVMDNAENMVEIPPEQLDKVRNGEASLMVTYINGRRVCDLIHPETSKK